MHEGRVATPGDLGSQSEAERACEEGRGNYKTGKFDLALDAFNRAIALDNRDANAFLWRAATHSRMGEHDRAISDYGEAARLDPQRASAYSGRGLSYYKKGEYDRAIADYNEAIRLDPKLAETYNRRGNAYFGKGEYDCAVADYDESIRLNPQSAVTYVNRGMARHDKGEYDQAIVDYDKAIRLDPTNGGTHYSRALAHAHKGARDPAKADYREALRLGLPDSTKALAETALAELEKPRFRSAVDRLISAASVLAGAAFLLFAIPAALFVGYVVWNFDGIWNIPHHSNKFAVYCLIFLPLFALIGMVAAAFKLLDVKPAQSGNRSSSDSAA